MEVSHISFTVYNISSKTAYQIKPNLAGMVLGSHFEIMSKMAALNINAADQKIKKFLLLVMASILNG
jgi:hypothetical protein